MVLQNATGDGMPEWEAEAMYSPTDLLIQQIVFPFETHTRCVYFQSGIEYCLSMILQMYKPGIYAGL